MKRKYMTIEEIRQEAIENGIEYTLEEGEKVEDLGICALVDVENMGFCKDDVTRWYHFTNNAGEPCIYIKQGALTSAERGER